MILLTDEENPYPNPETTVLVKFLAQGKSKIYEKKDAITFPDINYLDKYINENKLRVIPESEFKASRQESLMHLIKAV